MHRFKTVQRIFILTVILGCFVNCSNLLYYPDHVKYVEEELLEFKPEDIVLKIKEGEVHGWYFSTPKKPKAVVVFFHGNGQNRTSHVADLYWLVKEGYDLYAIEYPGYGETDGVPTPKNTVEAGHAALRYVAQRKPGVPIVVYGHSLGGAVAMRTVLDMKNEVPVKLLVVASTFLSYREVGQKVLAKAWVTWLFQYLPYAVLSDKYAPGDEIKNLAPIPLIVMHGKSDPVVPYVLGEEVFAKASEPKEFWEIPGVQHNQIFSGENGLEMRKKFLKKLPN